METLVAYRVGDHDYYAAYSKEGAFDEHLKHSQVDKDDCDESLDDVKECDAFELNQKWADDDVFIGTTQELLTKATEPGWLVGSE